MRRLLAQAMIAGACLGLTAEAAAGPVLTPDVGPRLEAAFARAEPQFHLRDARIGPDQARATVCRQDGTCLDLLLTPAQEHCAGRALGEWCLAFAGEEPPDAQVLTAALGASGGPTSWRGLLAGWLLLAAVTALGGLWASRLLRPGSARNGRAGPRAAAGIAMLACGLGVQAWLAWRLHEHPQAAQQVNLAGWLAVWWLAPLHAGALAGLGLRTALGRRPQLRWPAGILLAGAPLAGALGAVLSQACGAMDGAAMALVAAMAALGTGHGRFANTKAWLLAAATTLLALGALEAVLRLGPPPPAVEPAHAPLWLAADPDGRSPRPDGLPVSHAERLVDCALHASVGEETARCLRLHAPPRDQPWLVHLGDSMVFGSGVAESDALPAVWSRLMPAALHLNAGVPGTSLDVQAVLLQRLLAAAAAGGAGKPLGVLLYLMPGNDIDELAAPVESCGGLAASTLVAGEIRAACPQPRWRPRPPLEHLLQSRLPLPIAALVQHSWLARRLEIAHFAAVEPLRVHQAKPGGAVAPYASTLQAVVRALHKSGVPVQVVLMPLRRSVFGGFAEARRAQIAEALRMAGVQALDSQPEIDAWVGEDGESAVFLDQPPGDIHLNPDGLRRLGSWLAAHVTLTHTAAAIALPTQATPAN